MFESIALVVLMVAWLAALGRSATPRAERLPWRSWTVSDLAGNVWLGARRLAELQERNPVTPHRVGLAQRSSAGQR